MGGAGSGRWYRWNTRPTLDDVKRLDIRWLLRHGCLQPGRSASVTWHQGERQTGSILVTRQQEDMVLTYRHRSGGGDWQDVRQVIVLDWTSCHYGGQRPWFRCSGCHRRVAVLCLDGQWFLCRHCYGLPYASQQETVEDRHYRKVHKIRDRLGASYNLTQPPWSWNKPKGMHWRTFERLCAQERAMQQVVLEDMAVSIETLAAGLKE